MLRATSYVAQNTMNQALLTLTLTMRRFYLLVHRFTVTLAHFVQYSVRLLNDVCPQSVWFVVTTVALLSAVYNVNPLHASLSVTRF